jgi:low affinity Fe/Cu permease
MKKLFAAAAFLLLCGFTSVMAQGGGDRDPAAMKARMKERVKPQLIESTKVTDAEADKVIDIYFDAQQEQRKLRDLSEDERTKKGKEITDARDKKLKEIPLSDEKVKAVVSFYDEMRKKMMEGRGNRPAGGGGN